MWSYLAPAHPRPLQTDNGRNVLPPVQSCTSNILKLCPSALPHHHKKLKSYSTRPRLISSAVFLINICVAILESSHFRHPCCVLSFCLLWYLHFFLHKTIWHQDTTTDKLASRFQNRQFCTEHAVFLCSITHYWTLVNLQDLDQAVVCQCQGGKKTFLLDFYQHFEGWTVIGFFCLVPNCPVHSSQGPRTRDI